MTADCTVSYFNIAKMEEVKNNVAMSLLIRGSMRVCGPFGTFCPSVSILKSIVINTL